MTDERGTTGDPSPTASGDTSSVTPSPRPSYAGATPVRAAATALHLWGDAEAGEVADWIYVSNERIHHLVFGLSPGGSFRHSNAFRTIFAADELLYVLEGTMIIANPETGEVHRLPAGDAVSFRRDTWHHAFSYGPEALRVVEFFAPPPATGASSAYARTKELLATSQYLDRRWVGTWPERRQESREAATLRVARRDDDLLWEIAGPNGGALVGLYLSTEHLHAGRVEIRPGGRTGRRAHGGDLSLHVLEGPIHVLLTESVGLNGARWFELERGDGFYLPGGSGYELFNMTSGEVATLFAVAPEY